MCVVSILYLFILFIEIILSDQYAHNIKYTKYKYVYTNHMWPWPVGGHLGTPVITAAQNTMSV